MDTITTKSNHFDLVTLLPIPEILHASPTTQENVLTAHRHEESNFDTLNCYPNS